MPGPRTLSRGKKACPHTETVVLRIATLVSINAGLERVVCQACGHLSVRPLDDISSPAAPTSSHPLRAADSPQPTSL